MAKGVAATRPQRRISAATQALLDEMRGDTPVASDEMLNAVGAKLRQLRDSTVEIAALEERLSRAKAANLLIREKELVDLMDAAGMNAAGLPASGNLPAMDVEIVDYCHANIAAEWEEPRKQKAFAWLRKHHPGMLKNTITISLPRGSEKMQKALETALKKLKVPYKNEFGVPWNTLTAFVKEQLENKRRPPLELLGATTGRVAKIKKQKEK